MVVGISPEGSHMSQDRIEIKDLLVRGVIGVNDWERQQPQDILINLTLFADLHQAGLSDDIDQTVNYRSVTKQILQHVEATQRFTIEALAADVARMCLQQPGVEKVRVRLEKPGALRFARSVGVEIDRQAEDFA